MCIRDRGNTYETIAFIACMGVLCALVVELFSKKGIVWAAGLLPVSYTHLDVYKRQGYGRAARMMDLLESRGIIAPADNTNRPRKVLVE